MEEKILQIYTNKHQIKYTFNFKNNRDVSIILPYTQGRGNDFYSGGPTIMFNEILTIFKNFTL